MAGIFDYQDPDSVGRMMFAAGLLNAAGPSKMPVSVGQALSQGLLARQQGASEAAQNARRNAFVEAQTRKLLSESEGGGKKPAAVQTALWYANASPEEKAALRSTIRAQPSKMIGGILHVPDFDTGQWRPATPEEEQLRMIYASEATKTSASEGVKAAYDLTPAFDPNTRQDVFTTRYRQLGDMGAIPQIPSRLPNAAALPPQPFSLQGAPRAGTGQPNVPPPGINPNGYPSVDGLRSYIQNPPPGVPVDNVTGVPVPTAGAQVASAGQGMRPPAAGNPARTQATSESDVTGKGLGDLYTKIQASGYGALTTMSKLQRFEALLTGVETGKLTPIGTEIAGYLKEIGIDIDPNLPNKQAADSLSKEMALMLRKPGEQAGGMPGNFSDADRNFLVAIAPGLANTPGGNRLIIQTLRKAAQREMEMSKLAFEYKQKNGTMDGFAQAAKAYADSNPLYTEEIQQAKSMLGGSQSVPVGTRRKTKDGRDVEFDGTGWKLVTP
jgi:hypothetical protein